MRFIGLTDLETQVTHAVAIGESYQDIANRLGIELYEVIAADMQALDKLKKNKYASNESEVRKIMKVTFLIMLCLLPMERARMRVNEVRIQARQEMVI